MLLIRWFLRWRRPLAHTVSHCLTTYLRHVYHFISSCLVAGVKKKRSTQLARQTAKRVPVKPQCIMQCKLHYFYRQSIDVVLGFLINRIMENMVGVRQHYHAKGTWSSLDPHRHLEVIPLPNEVKGKITALQAILKSTGVLPEQGWKIRKSVLKSTLDSGCVARRLYFTSLKQWCYSNYK